MRLLKESILVAIALPIAFVIWMLVKVLQLLDFIWERKAWKR